MGSANRAYGWGLRARPRLRPRNRSSGWSRRICTAAEPTNQGWIRRRIEMSAQVGSSGLSSPQGTLRRLQTLPQIDSERRVALLRDGQVQQTVMIQITQRGIERRLARSEGQLLVERPIRLPVEDPEA